MNKDVLFQFEIDSSFKVKSIVSLKPKKIISLHENALNNLIKNFEIKGFRKGKVPFNLAIQKISPIEKNNAYLKAKINFCFKFMQSKIKELKIISKPDYKIIQDDENLFKINFSFLTQETLFVSEIPQYKNLNFFKPKVQVAQKEIETQIELLRKNQALYESVDKLISLNDYVTIDYEGFIDDKEFLNNKAKNTRLLIGSNTFIKGFETGLLNHKKNDLVTLHLNYPQNYKIKHLANRRVMFKIRINDVEKIILPKIDQEFFEELHNEKIKDLKSLQEFVKKELFVEKTKKLRQNYLNLILGFLRSKAKILIPKNLIEQNLKNRFEQFKSELKKKDFTLEKYLQVTNYSEKEIEKELKNEIIEQIKNEALILKIKNLENISVLNSEVNKQLKIFKKYAQNKNQKIDFNFLKEKLTIDMLKNKVFDFLFNNNK